MESPCKAPYAGLSSPGKRLAGSAPGVCSDDMTSGVLMRTVLRLPVLTRVRVGSVAVTRAWHHSRAAARPQRRPPDPARKRSGMKAEQPSSSPAPSPKLSLTALASAAEKAGICPQRLVLDLAALAGIRSPTKTHSCRHSGSKLLPQPSWRNRSGISESGASDDTSGRRTVVAPEDPWQSTDSLHSCRPSIC